MNFSFLGDRMLNSTILYRSCSNNPSYCKLNGTVAISRWEDSQVITSGQCSTTTLQYILLKLKLLLSLLFKIKFIIIISVYVCVCACYVCVWVQVHACLCVEAKYNFQVVFGSLLPSCWNRTSLVSSILCVEALAGLGTSRQFSCLSLPPWCRSPGATDGPHQAFVLRFWRLSNWSRSYILPTLSSNIFPEPWERYYRCPV